MRGNKLGLSRAKYCQRVQIARTNLAAQQARVRNDVATRFYHVLAAQRTVELLRQLTANATDKVQTFGEMLNLGQLGEAEVLQAEIEVEREQLMLRQADQEFWHAWRELMANVGEPAMEPTPLIGSLETDVAPLDWESALGELLANSPLLDAARQKIRHDRIAIQRERAEPIPNLTVGVAVGQNTEVNQTVAEVTIGMPLPIFNRNQGTVRQAEADLRRSCAEVDRLELELHAELARQYRDYQSAWQAVDRYQQTILPKSRSAVAKLEQSYQQRRATWLSVLSAKQMLLELEREHVNNLLAYQQANIAIRGRLLSGGLTEPEGPMPGGHIDAIAQPR